jgi:hypothetical protein
MVLIVGSSISTVIFFSIIQCYFLQKFQIYYHHLSLLFLHLLDIDFLENFQGKCPHQWYYQPMKCGLYIWGRKLFVLGIILLSPT